MADGEDGHEVWRWRLLRDLSEFRNRDDEEFWEAFLWPGPEDAEVFDEQAYDQALDSACAAARRSQGTIRKDQAKRDRALEMLSNPKLRYSSYRGAPLASAYLKLSYNERHRSPSRMLYFADQARFEAEIAQPEHHLPGVVYDLRARVWAELANAYRVNERYSDASGALSRAHQYIPKGSGDLGLLARTRDIEASLCLARRSLSEAQKLLDEAHLI
jgi:tetratricopeptide (TPR) repeat protein